MAASDPLRFVDGYLPYLLARASHLISGEFHRKVEAAGLAVTEWRVLATLSDRDACTVGALADITLTKQPTLTKLLDRMEADGLVTRRRDGSPDRRHALVSISAKGRDRVRPLLEQARAHEAEVLAAFGASQGGQLKETLRRLIALHAGR
ncbi:DNA-binding MarR family transcriptional regulator [Cupriavidus gilardii J11]|uniref:DNA-binding MarR family transcriptional regulator n=1 Tax=Cupriavidus gilardii J11 TaxID=936133 RepID=A0A562BLV2_9BURK|nr:MarR family winged helix-turn-helix transcriptional regulator [Cupriavidus gilardii]TWG86217.1 DNA-binding MarR family transcriptional regulator [Cupriavidus gilardii J11]